MDYNIMDTSSRNPNTEVEKPEKNYQILTIAEVIELVNSVSFALSKIEILKITPPTAKYLLDFYGWDVAWLEKNLLADRNMVFKLAGIEDPSSKTRSIISEVRKAVKKFVINDKPKVCCYCNDGISNQFNCVSYCKHHFCDRCWFFLLNHQIQNPIVKTYVKCPKLKCLVSYEIVMHFLFENKVVDFQRSTIRSFVENNDYFHWCPNAKCMHITKIENVQVGKVKCKCGHTYCLKCREEWHSPITCEMVQKWLIIWQNHRSKNMKVCSECDLIVKEDQKCPLCLTDSEKEEEKEKARKKLSTDDFYRLSYACICYELEDQIKPNCDLEKLFQNFLDVDETSPRDKDIDELRKYMKYIVVFAYFLNSDHPYVENFFKYLKKFKDSVYFIYYAVPPCYGETQDNEFKKKIKDKMERAYYFMEILNNVITEGCNEGWWSFKDEQ